MNPSISPSKMRRKRLSSKLLVSFAQVIISICRVIFRVLEVVGPRSRREKLRQLRYKLDAIAMDKAAVTKQIQDGAVFEGIIAATERFSRHASSREQAGLQETGSNLRMMFQESRTLKSIYVQAGDDKKSAVAKLQEYIEDHPDSHSAFSYLGIVYNQLNDTRESISAYQEAIRLAGEDSVPGASSRIQLGEVLRQKVDRKAAIIEFRRVIDEATPKTESMICIAYLHLGTVLNEEGERQEARSSWQQAIKWDETGPVAKKARELLKQNP